MPRFLQPGMVRRGSPAQVRLFGTAFKSALPQRKHSLWRRDVSPPTPECRLRPEEGNHHAEYHWPESPEGNAVAPAPRESADRASGEHAAAEAGESRTMIPLTRSDAPAALHGAMLYSHE